MHQKLFGFFTDGVSRKASERIGIEVETIHIGPDGQPVDACVTQTLLRKMVTARPNDWTVKEYGEYRGQKRILAIANRFGDHVVFEIGVANIEVVTRALAPKAAIATAQGVLDQLGEIARKDGRCRPYYGPIVTPRKSVIAPMTKREHNFLKLHGEDLENMMACTACVQFTIEVTPDNAIKIINRLRSRTPEFLATYPQDELWKRYLHESNVGYRADRYGNPTEVNSIDEYCRQLARHDVVTEHGLVPHNEAGDINLTLFVKSVWWHFRLRRYGNQLCLEIRPISRGTDGEIANSWNFVEEIVRD